MNTKRMLLLLVFSFFAISLIKAQQITYGIQAGGGISSIIDVIQPDVDIDFKTGDYYKPITSYSFNAYLGYKSGSFWGVSVEPGFVQKGAKTRNSIVGDTDTPLVLNYLQLPVLANIYLGEKITVSLGPDFSCLLSSKAKLNNGSRESFDGGLRKTEVSGMIGVSYALTGKIDVGMQYSHGITPILNLEFFDEQGLLAPGRFKLYNQYGQFYLRFKI